MSTSLRECLVSEWSVNPKFSKARGPGHCHGPRLGLKIMGWGCWLLFDGHINRVSQSEI